MSSSEVNHNNFQNNNNNSNQRHNYHNHHHNQQQLQQQKPPQQQSHLGITEPISKSGPKELDLRATTELEKCLHCYELFECELELNKRCLILASLNKMLREWVRELSIKKMPSHIVDQMNGKIFTFGSYRLGVHTKG